ncbi:MAG: sulfatase-like hydrolase/transferase [Ruminococcus sp.]|nr:sulfatase-like hydrolase/transferase [Ruminococcus sp.]
MSAKHTKNNKPVSFKEKFGIDGNKILTSLLAGFTVPFVLLICATFSVYFSNSAEFTFALADFAPAFILISLGIFAVITAALLLTKGTLRHSIFTLCAFLVTAGFIQSLVTNMTFQGMPGDGNAEYASTAKIMINFTVWVALCSVFLWFGLLSKKAETGRSIMTFLLVLVLVMQTVSLIPAAITYANEQAKPDDTTMENKDIYLTTDGMFELSSKDNIVVIVLDRFDDNYFKEILNSGSPYLDSLDGFTYYEDNIAKYPRTYPAVTSMLTGMENDYTGTRTQYFEDAYTRSTFLPDLKANNYEINLYIPSYYAYDNAAVFGDLVANTSAAEGYTISSKGELIGKLFELSSYFWAPEIFKSNSIGSSSFGDIVTLDGDAPKYEMTETSDPEIYKNFVQTGLTTQNKKNTFSFLHLRGCHSPYAMDENCNLAEKNSVTSLQQTTGCFKFISEYIAQMKKLGIYENATIIITGDHAALDSDSKEYANENLTGLLVKKSGDSGTKLQISSAQVSQDNLHATIVKSAGIKTSTDYGLAYDEVPVGQDMTRIHYFQLYTGSDRKDENLTYTITGDGTDFANWDITDREHIGYMYK